MLHTRAHANTATGTTTNDTGHHHRHHKRNTVAVGHTKKAVAGRHVEYWLLMELCPHGHVVDMMNTRIGAPFTEKEVLAIFEPTCRGVQSMHALQPPIAHRDIKPENVLCVAGTYKVCDFGSATVKHCTPGVDIDREDAKDDIEKMTTIQYRAPEQCDLWGNKRINEKVDVWALGVLLYKVMFFEDAFGESTLAIMGGKYTVDKASNIFKT